MPDVTVEVEVYCARCGDGLCNQTESTHGHSRGVPQFRVDPCEKCLEEARDETRDEVAQESFDEGRSEGRSEGFDEGHTEGHAKGMDEGYDNGYEAALAEQGKTDE